MLWLRCKLLMGHLWCWDIATEDIYEIGGTIVTCARCGSASTFYFDKKPLYLNRTDFASLSREEAEQRAAA